MDPTHALLQCDVTDTRAYLERFNPPLSLTAYLVGAVARAAAAHPEVHAYRNWRGRLAIHHHVDVATLIEVRDSTGSFPLAHLVRDADRRSPGEISAEIRDVKADPTAGASGRIYAKTGPLVARIPGAVALFYLLAGRSVRMRRITGTVSVTSVGMFGGGGGFGIGHPTIQTLTVLVGGISRRPWVVDGEIIAREVLDLHRDGRPRCRRRRPGGQVRCRPPPPDREPRWFWRLTCRNIEHVRRKDLGFR